MDHTTKFSLALAEAAQHQRAGQLLAAEAVREFEAAERKRREQRGHRFSISRAIKCMTAEGGGGLRDGFEAELCQEAARQSGRSYDPNRVVVPWQALDVRAMTVGSATSAGYLVGGDARGPAADALWSYSTVVKLGAQVLPNLTADINVPRFGTNASAAWLGETGTATHSGPVLAQIACSPKTVGGYVELSRQLLLQSDAEAVLGRHLLGLIGAEIDKAVIAGTSTDSTQPLGIRYAAGVTVSTGTSFANSTTMSLLKAVADGNAVDERVAFIGAQTTRQTLGNRGENGTGSRFIWSGRDIAGRAAYVNSNAPANSLFVGDYSAVWLPVWGVGPMIELNPFAGFQSAIVGLRCFASVDVAVTQPAAFAVSVGIT